VSVQLTETYWNKDKFFSTKNMNSLIDLVETTAAQYQHKVEIRKQWHWKQSDK